jgi:hypothetical protein
MSSFELCDCGRGSGVLESRTYPAQERHLLQPAMTKRRRICKVCGKRRTTIELPEQFVLRLEADLRAAGLTRKADALLAMTGTSPYRSGKR